MPFIPLWVTACAVAGIFTAVYGADPEFPLPDLASLWAAAAALTAWLTTAPPRLVFEFYGGEDGDSAGPASPGSGWPGAGGHVR